MTIDRRDMVKAVALGGATMAAGATPAMSAPQGSKIVHHVFFWLKNAGSAADRDQLVTGLRALAEIPVIRSLEIGVPASTEQRDVVDSSFDVSELMAFDSVADQKIYQDHPIHADFVAKHAHLWRKVIVYDMLTL
jgi:hypothetical protein